MSYKNLQPKTYKQLSVLIRKGTIPHALLFEGIEGVGKRTAAMMFAMACNCHNISDSPGELSENQERSTDASSLLAADNCTCKSCRKIRSGNHPDIHLIEPSGAFIKIDQIRDLCHTFSMKPYEAKMRVAIIGNAQCMNPEAANSLLKILEEPPDRSLLILTVSHASDLLPTILSRCQHIRFYPIARKHLEALTAEAREMDQNEAAIMAILANGSLSRLGFEKSAAYRKNQINRRNWLIRELEFLTGEHGKSFPIARIMAFAEKLSKNKEWTEDALEIMKSWFRDLIVCRLFSDTGQAYADKLINKDLVTSIQKISSKTTVSSLLSNIGAIQSAQRKLRSNTNLRLTLEALMITVVSN